MRKREGREKGKKTTTLAHGFIFQGSKRPRYWEVSGEKSPSIGGGFRGIRGGEGERRKREMRECRRRVSLGSEM
jgi:hypothetical protein